MWKIVCIVVSAVFAFAVGAQMTGGFSTISTSDRDALDALNFAVVEHNKGTNDMFVFQPTRVLRVQRQVVSGFKYKITVEMSRTTCRKGGANEVCDIHRDPALARTYQCTFTVWTQAWLQNTQLLDQKC